MKIVKDRIKSHLGVLLAQLLKVWFKKKKKVLYYGKKTPQKITEITENNWI